MGYDFVKVEKKNRLTVVTINRPEVMNALHPAASLELNTVFDDFAADPKAWVAIITGAGEKAFCAGNDLKWQATHGPEVFREKMKSLTGGFGGLTSRFDCFKPLIAAVNGLALGGGFEMVLACDIVVASERAFFALPEPTVGNMAACGGVHRLPRSLPHQLAMGYLLTGTRIPAEQALAFGLVNEIVPQGDTMPAALAWAEKVLKCAPLSIQATKEAALKGMELPLPAAIQKVFPGMKRMRSSDDFVEGPRAFAEKRNPRWQGR